MLKPLPTRKIDAALAKWGTELTSKDITRLNIIPGWVEIDRRDGEEQVIEFESGDAVLVEGCRQLYGGNLDDVMRIEVFRSGYAVHLKTDVFDGDEMVCEVRVGGLC